MFEQAKEYLARVIPWPQDGDPPAYLNIHWTKPNTVKPNGPPFWDGRAVRSLQEAIGTLGWITGLADTKDVYVCMSTQLQAEEKISRTGHPYRKALRSQSNAVALKSLFLDIDLKEGPNGYATIDEATRALAAFLKAVDLPRPNLVVMSGGGLHCYFTLDRALPPHEWQDLADALAEATKKHGLKCDTQCTIDSARVLRVPDTFNRKLEEPRPVKLAGKPGEGDYSVERIERALTPYIGLTVRHTPVSPLPPRPPLTGVSDLSAGVEKTNSQPINIDSVAQECGFIRDTLANNGRDNPNPLWNITNLIATFCEDGRTQAHRMSSGHATYNKDATDEQFDRKEREKVERGLGWPSCRTISGSGSKACQSCVHFAVGRSPLNYGRASAATIELAQNSGGTAGGAGGAVGGTAPSPASGMGKAPGQKDLPSGYIRRADLVICQQKTDPNTGLTTAEPLCTYPMFDPQIQQKPASTMSFSTIIHRKEKVVSVSLKDAASTAELKKSLWDQMMTVSAAEATKLGDFFVSWIKQLQTQASNASSYTPFGWHTENGQIDGFVYGFRIWGSGTDRAASMPGNVLAEQYTPVGDVSVWKEAAAMITDQKRPQLDAILASAFGAPLVRFSGQYGPIMCAYSLDTGIGKSSALKVAQAVWGSPVTAMQSLSDTQNSVINKIGEIQALPLYWDELKTKEDSKKFVNMAFQLSIGKEKSRLSSGASQRAIGQWKTMLVSTSNESLLNTVADQTKTTAAGLVRIFEYEVTPGTTGQINPARADQIVSKLDYNFGQVGLAYAKFLGANHQRIAQEVQEFREAFAEEVLGKADERMWMSLITCICMGAKYCNELGFTYIDEEALKAFMVKALADMRGERDTQTVDMKKDVNVTAVLSDFLNSVRARGLIKTNKLPVGPGKPVKMHVLNLAQVGRFEVLSAHIGVEDQRLRISSSAFKKWCEKNDYVAHTMVKNFVREFNATKGTGIIGAGTEHAGSAERVIEFKLSQPKLSNLLEI